MPARADEQDRILAQILGCPVCHAPLDDAQCPVCGRRYPDRHYAPVPPPDRDVRAKWGLWEQLQANGAEVYDGDPAGNLSVGDRGDARAFAEFAQLTGWVLDVGCGPQALPSYAGGDHFVGIDPLAGGRREFAFVQGIAEYLPFRDGVFDRVLFATSLDHMLSPQRAIAEARRVIKPDGLVCVWHGEPPLPPERSWRDRVRQYVGGGPRPLGYKTPRGAADPFHVSHPRFATILQWLRDGGLAVDREHRDEIGNCHVAARRTDSRSYGG
jgi:SAM-dependent methyltransferase